jgi:hypothetical protein
LKLVPYPSPCTEINSKWIKNFNVKVKILKLLEKNIGETLQDIFTGEDFLNNTLIDQEIRARVDRWDYN